MSSPVFNRTLEKVDLEKGEIIYLSGDDIEYAYFLDSGLFSLLSTTETGSSIEVAMVSNEGIVGLPVIIKKQNGLVRSHCSVPICGIQN